MDVESIVTVVAIAFEVIGAVAMCIGFLIALALGCRSLRRGEGGQAAFQVLRTTLGSAILLGLEVLVAADLRARRHGSALEVVVSRRLGELLAETRLDEVLAVRPADS